MAKSIDPPSAVPRDQAGGGVAQTLPPDALARLTAIVGAKYVLTRERAMRRYRTGYRFGGGPVATVVRPGTLVEQWRVLQICVAAGAVVIMQAANTGLTGGSTPDGDGYERPVVIISTLRIDAIHLLDGARQVVCLPGATLYQLEMMLLPHGREPHSVIGSSCIGASVFGGVSNNSGGSLIRRGPAYTELALYARLDESGDLVLVNHLGLDLGDGEAMLDRLDRGDLGDVDIATADHRCASDPDYGVHVRDVDANTPARFNADARKLFEASGSAGKLILFAVRLDTFAREADTHVFYIGTNDPHELGAIRRDMLGHDQLPVAAEYIHREAFDIAAVYGKDTFLAIQALGTNRLPRLFAAKAWVDGITSRSRLLPDGLSDMVMQRAGRLFPHHLPRRMRVFRDRYEHHLMIKVSATARDATVAYLATRFPSSKGDSFECSVEEGAAAFLHRFAVAGAAVRYRAIHPDKIEDIVSLDIALRRNDRDWFETLPDDIAAPIVHRLYYGHFFCHVFHQDYLVAKGHDVLALEHRMWALLDKRGAEYPAEHNVGHLYLAKPALAAFYRRLDPCNAFNPGVGKQTKRAGWAE